MPQSNNILQELQELQSSLNAGIAGNIYSVPAGYFDGLLDQVMKRIKALEAASAKEELEHLSPLLNSISREMPYELPQGYFESLDTGIDQTPQQELESISPLLSGMKKQMPYEVPEGYFDTLHSEKRNEVKPAKVVSLTSRKWFRYAAAAVITGLVALGAVSVWKKNNDVEGMSIAKFEKKLNKEIKKMSDTELDDFLKSSDPTLVGNEKSSAKVSEEIEELFKDVSDSELEKFLEETSPDTGIETSTLN